MKPITLVIARGQGPAFEETLGSFLRTEMVEEVIATGPLTSRDTLLRLAGEVGTDYLLLAPRPLPIRATPDDLATMIGETERTGAALAYSDFYEDAMGKRTIHPLNDYQPGSVRDDFDFGPLMLIPTDAFRSTIERRKLSGCILYAGLYDLRLTLSIDAPIHHISRPLYSVLGSLESWDQENLFSYVDPRNQAVQKEMEEVFTDYLREIHAYLPPRLQGIQSPLNLPFPVEASVVIPVRNRRSTVGDAVRSALSQKTVFPFNVIVVDNHSTDGTTALLKDLAGSHPRLCHIVPERTDLGIGGCWNVALKSTLCGRYAVQLDSDDLYEGEHSLSRIVEMFHSHSPAMVIGSYTLVNEEGEQIPPGLIDHREWTDKNGHNNALRINGLGAPRAFDTALMRTIGFLNVSYGEDYAAALRICRDFRIGRIFESLYRCRRWSGNTDAHLTIEQANRNDAFKDRVRTDEIKARQAMNRKGP